MSIPKSKKQRAMENPFFIKPIASANPRCSDQPSAFVAKNQPVCVKWYIYQANTIAIAGTNNIFNLNQVLNCLFSKKNIVTDNEATQNKPRSEIPTIPSIRKTNSILFLLK